MKAYKKASKKRESLCHTKLKLEMCFTYKLAQVESLGDTVELSLIEETEDLPCLEDLHEVLLVVVAGSLQHQADHVVDVR